MDPDQAGLTDGTGAPGARLIAALGDPHCYPHTVSDITTLETHISWVVLTGQFAYKIKKPIKLPFLDFSTIELRRHFCEEEVRLNRTLAPGLYLGVVAIRGTPAHPTIEGTGPVLDYAVRMRQFSQDALASTLIRQGALTPELVTSLARDLARFHARTGVAAAESPHGSDGCVRDQVLAVVDELQSLIGDAREARGLSAIRAWVEQSCARLQDQIAARKRAGFVRECHGDLHLGNVVLLDGKLTPFDGIEFNASLRWIDVVSEAAFLAMDLAHYRRRDLASRFIDAYLECTGDYGSIALLRFYIVYRALVRAMTHALLARRMNAAEAAATGDYLELATAYVDSGRGAVFLMHGLSGSGKSTVALDLIQASGGLRVRSDVERKRLHGLEALECSGSSTGAGLYAQDATAATYGRLQAIARSIAEAGFPVFVDAACLKRDQREDFRALAAQLGVPFTIVSLQATPDVLRTRVAQRRAGATDASEATLAVLERQFAEQEPLSRDELRDAVIVNSAQGLSDHARDAVIARL